MKHTLLTVTGDDTLIQVMSLVNGYIERDAERNKGRGIKTAAILPMPFVHHFFASDHVDLLSYDAYTEQALHGLSDVRGKTYQRIILVSPLGGLRTNSEAERTLKPLLAGKPDLELIQFSTMMPTRDVKAESLATTRLRITPDSMERELAAITRALLSRKDKDNLLVLPFDIYFTEEQNISLKAAYDAGQGSLTVVRYYKDGPEGEQMHIDRSRYVGKTFNSAFYLKQSWMTADLEWSIKPTLLAARVEEPNGGQFFLYDVAAPAEVEA